MAPFGSLIPNRHGSSSDYRYGFQGQEKDDELKGEGNSLNYTYRMHDPRIGRFFAVDPLTKKYPHYTPYSFSGNKVIAFVELEGLEEAMIVGSQRQLNRVNEFNANTPKDKQNWTAVKFRNLDQALLDIQNHKALGNKVKTLLIQAHAGAGFMQIFPGLQAEVNTEAGGSSHGNHAMSGSFLGSYMSMLTDINAIKNKMEKAERMADFKASDFVKKVESFLAVINEIEDGGTLILNGCHVFGFNKDINEDLGKEFSDNILAITGRRIHFVGAQDYVSDIVPESGGTKLFGGGLTPQKHEEAGYRSDSNSTGKDLQLNGTTDKPAFEFIPLKKDEKSE
ncbi:RHS repeat domain-containing protein [Flavobacterium columnare]|uniref:RHS repeat domain-containing protein n=1 Tax=Flavobacterium columnare TaxID=996 RepID=UPI001BC89178|nr:RHS repeat-associated core domain-containing protein [Flavobacterium columnare]AUX18668.1 hypothetical protein AQ623_10555 [Flavobacterium columnare]